MFQSDSYDVIVVGGGPAGATTAALIADAGRRVLLLERDPSPRFKIGESLIPATYDTLERLGMVERLSASHFTKKYSVQFFSRGEKASSPFYFEEAEGFDHPQTWQVVRSEFDQMLLDNAARLGAEVHRGVKVTEVLFDGERAVGVEVKAARGATRQDGDTTLSRHLMASVVVDASGQSGMLARRFELRQEDPQLRNAAIFSHFKGAHRDPGIDEGATLVMETRDKDSWFWYIPLPGDQVSVGVVAPLEYLVRPDDKRPPQEVFDEQVALCPALAERLEGSFQAFPAQVLRDFTYRSRQRAGDGWVLVGDAYGFIDPLYSSGVLLALKSGEMAADAICAGLAAGDVSAARLGVFEDEFLGGMEAFRKLVYAFYDKDFSFADFLRRFPERRDDVVKILLGGVFDNDFDGMFEDMAQMTRIPGAWALEPFPVAASSATGSAATDTAATETTARVRAGA